MSRAVDTTAHPKEPELKGERKGLASRLYQLLFGHAATGTYWPTADTRPSPAPAGVEAEKGSLGTTFLLSVRPGDRRSGSCGEKWEGPLRQGRLFRRERRHRRCSSPAGGPGGAVRHDCSARRVKHLAGEGEEDGSGPP